MNFKSAMGFSCKVSVVLIAFVFALAFAKAADAQELVLKNIHYFQPPSDGSGLIASWGSEPIGHLGLHVAAWGDYASQPLEWTDPYNNTHILIYDQYGVNLHAGFGLFSGISVSGAFAMTPKRTFNEDYITEGDSSAMEDSRVAVKYTFRNRRFDNWGLAAQFELTVPNGDETQYVSDEQMTFSPRVIFDIGNTWWTYVVNVGYKYYPEQIKPGLFDMEGGNELILTGGATFRFLWGVELMADVHGRTLIERLFNTGDIDYLEGFLGVRNSLWVDNPLAIVAGSGFGLLDGVGTPVVRGFVGVSWFMRSLGLP